MLLLEWGAIHRTIVLRQPRYLATKAGGFASRRRRRFAIIGIFLILLR